jgi:di/tricarboxylate transporter
MPAAASLGAMAMVVVGVLSPGEARQALDLRMLLVIGAAVGLGRALQHTGAADAIAATIVELGRERGGWFLLATVYVVAALLTEVVTNVAAAALVFPVAIAAATQAGVDPRPFAVAVAIGASASFLTPTGYQTNLMVYGPGGYRFTDYARLGAPIALWVFAMTMLLVPRLWAL